MTTIRFVAPDVTINTQTASDFQELYTRDPSIPLKFGCRRGCCGVCAIEVIEGSENLTPPNQVEVETLLKKRLPEGYRLACQCAFKGDVTVKPLNH